MPPLPEEGKGLLASVGDFFKDLGRAHIAFWLALLLGVLATLFGWFFAKGKFRKILFGVLGLIVLIVFLIVWLVKNFLYLWFVIILLAVYLVIAILFGRPRGRVGGRF